MISSWIWIVINSGPTLIKISICFPSLWKVETIETYPTFSKSSRGSGREATWTWSICHFCLPQNHLAHLRHICLPQYLRPKSVAAFGHEANCQFKALGRAQNHTMLIQILWCFSLSSLKAALPRRFSLSSPGLCSFYAERTPKAKDPVTSSALVSSKKPSQHEDTSCWMSHI